MGRPEATHAAAEAGPLDELRFHWGSAYDIGAAGGVYTARRRDRKGAALADALPEGLRLQIVADYAAHARPEGPAVTGGQRRGVLDVDEDRALAALRLAWGEAYDIGFERQKWVATRRDGGCTVDGDTPDALNRAIRADWMQAAAR